MSRGIMGKKPVSGIPQRKKAGGNRALKFLIVLGLGAAAGWYFAPPDKQKQMKAIAEQSTKDFPGALQKLKTQMPSASQATDLLGVIPIYIGRFYDDYVPQEFRDTLAGGFPMLFAHPYLCKIARVSRPGETEVNKNLAIPITIGGTTRELLKDGIIRPGLTILASGQLSTDVECRKLMINLERGGQLKFMRGEGLQKTLELRGNAMLRGSGESNIAFAFPWGEVGMHLGNSASQVQYRVMGSGARVDVLNGSADFTWKVGSTEPSNQEIFQIVANPGTRVNITYIGPDGESTRDIGPKRQASFLANGKISGVAGAFRGSNARSNSGGQHRDAPADGPPGLSITTPHMNVHAPGNQPVDVLLEWQLHPGARIVPCDIDMAADEGITKILAKYQSNEMRLMLKGMRPGLYFWRVGCNVDGKRLSTAAAKVVVSDGRRSASVPILLLPPNRHAIQDSSVVYQWERVEGAKYYVLQLSLDPKFQRFNEYLAKQGTGLKMNLKKKGKYFWRVYGIIGETKNDRTAYSTIWSFTF